MYDILISKIENIIKEEGQIELQKFKNKLEQLYKKLYKEKVIKLEEDYKLSGSELELRVEELFKMAGFNIERGRDSKEDFIIKPNSDFLEQTPLVLEVKSGKHQHVKLDDLRQLDDWVFDLSGEEKARKGGLGGGGDISAMVTGGFITQKKFHPTPYRGLLIYNQVGISFNKKHNEILNCNHREFAQKRNFCITSFEKLIIELNNVVQSNSQIEFWTKLSNYNEL